jgi:putative two-component system response regulator
MQRNGASSFPGDDTTRARPADEFERWGELSLDMIATANFDGFFTRVNAAWTRMLGYSAEELTSKPFLDFVHPDDREATIAAAAQQTLAGEPVIRFENRYRHRDGSYRWLEWNSRPDPEQGELIAIARDITGRKRLEETERRYKEMLELAVQERTSALQQRTRELDEARLEVLRRLALAAEYRDDQTFEHTQRVATSAKQLAERLGLLEDAVTLIAQASPLHDIGKLGVSDTILLKPGKLSHDEFEQVKRHTIHGSAILSGSRNEVLRLAEEIARTHHEWWDGSGYPHGLRGTQIPISGRIVAVADVFDALTHERPYKRAWPIEHAAAEINKLRGRQFDPDVVDAFQQLDPYELAGRSQTTGATAERILRVVA